MCESSDYLLKLPCIENAWIKSHVAEMKYKLHSQVTLQLH